MMTTLTPPKDRQAGQVETLLKKRYKTPELIESIRKILVSYDVPTQLKRLKEWQRRDDREAARAEIRAAAVTAMQARNELAKPGQRSNTFWREKLEEAQYAIERWTVLQLKMGDFGGMEKAYGLQPRRVKKGGQQPS